MSKAIKDGGPAFPNQIKITDEAWAELRGMTLRDYFAAKAMQGFAADGTCSFPDGISGMAKCAYNWADAMLEARGDV